MFCNRKVPGSNSGPETGHRAFVGFTRPSKHTGMVSRIPHDHSDTFYYVLFPLFAITIRRCSLKQPTAYIVTGIKNTDFKGPRTFRIVCMDCRWTNHTLGRMRPPTLSRLVPLLFILLLTFPPHSGARMALVGLRVGNRPRSYDMWL